MRVVLWRSGSPLPFLCTLLWLASAGCGDGTSAPVETDSGVPPDETCTSDVECSDGLFCNGTERCAPGASGADANGCVGAPSPCLENQTCSEASQTCRTTCAVTEDADDDGHRAMDCGGDDCDDSDANRYPGNTEVCDVDDHDEDCDPSTFGFRDQDMDGVADAACCNVDQAGARVCGLDCDDTAPGVNPTATEACDGIDNDCDAELDEGVLATFYRDADGDGFGDPTMPVQHACTEVHGDSLNGFDCDDTSDSVRPGAAEICDGRDNNCDGLYERDLDQDGHLDPSSVCAPGTHPTDDCNDFSATTFGGAAELCDRVDNDCDGRTDERVEADLSCAHDGIEVGYCISGTCVRVHCEEGLGDCNGNELDGCEVDLSNTSEHCGACGAVCPLGEACSAGQCVRPVATQLAVGGTHACVITDDGVVGCWGRNTEGQLGGGTSETRAYVSRSTRLPNATSLATSDQTTCVVGVDGQVYCDGNNTYGERGVGDRSSGYALATETLGVSSASRVLGHTTNLCAQDTANGVSCWGWSGLFVDDAQASPTVVGGAVLTLGADALCGIGGPLAGLWCLGADDYGQLGDAADHPLCNSRHPFFTAAIEGPCSPAPVSVSAPLSATMVAAGSQFGCAGNAQETTCWGTNSFGELNAAPSPATTVPMAVWAQPPGVPEIVELSAGKSHVCQRRSNGTVNCWGRNQAGQLGRGTLSANERDAPITSALEFTTVVAGGDSTCALDNDGQPWCWGANDDGQVGDRTLTDRPLPTRVLGFDAPRSIVRGPNKPCALTRTGELMCWGSGDVVAQRVDGVDEASLAVSGGGYRCVLRGDGEVWCAGFNTYGELGTGAADVGMLLSWTRSLVGPARDLSANASTTCAVLRTGEVFCWGGNAHGQLATDTVPHSGDPLRIPGISEAVSVTVGTTHVCALLRGGQVECWGDGGSGQLGDGLARDRLSPTRVLDLDDVVEVRAGDQVTCARRADTTVSCWGSGTQGELGAGSNRPFASSPQAVRNLSGATNLHLVAGTACVINDLAEVWCWGRNASSSASGDGMTFAPLFVAARVPDLLATDLGGNSVTTCAIGLDESVRCWGESSLGDAGTFSTTCSGTCDPSGCSAFCMAPVTIVPGI